MTTTIPLTPDPNNGESIQQHKQQVLIAYGLTFGLVDQALRDSVRRATDWFGLLGGSIDLSVHAAVTRYLTKLYLSARDVAVENEEALFELEKIPNCGLCLEGQGYEIRILKNSSEGVPKAASEARSRFYSSNQLQLTFSAEHSASQPRVPLNLVLLWDMDSSYSYSGLEVACPRGERNDGTVDCYWKERWKSIEVAPILPEQAPPTSEADLDEIRAFPTKVAASS